LPPSVCLSTSIVTGRNRMWRRWRPMRLIRRPAVFRFLIVGDRDHAKFVRNEDPPERCTVVFDHVARLKIAEGVYCANGVVDLRRGSTATSENPSAVWRSRAFCCQLTKSTTPSATICCVSRSTAPKTSTTRRPSRSDPISGSSANRTETRAGRLNANHRAVNKSRWLQQPENHLMS